MTIFETRMNELLAAEDLRCVFVFTNAEEMGLFNPIMLQHFLNFVTMVSGILFPEALYLSPLESAKHETADG